MAILVLAVVAAWWIIVGRVDKMIHDIENASTSEEERAAFQATDGRIGIQLGFEAFDRQGRMVDMSVHRWWESVVTMRIELNDREVDHTVIDPENIDILMNE